MQELPSDKIGAIYFPLMLCGAGAGALVLAYQAVSWLFTGEWDSLPIGPMLGWHTDSMPMRGLALIVDWIGGIGLGIALIFTSLLSFLVVEPFMNFVDAKARSRNGIKNKP